MTYKPYNTGMHYSKSAQVGGILFFDVIVNSSKMFHFILPLKNALNVKIITIQYNKSLYCLAQYNSFWAYYTCDYTIGWIFKNLKINSLSIDSTKSYIYNYALLYFSLYQSSIIQSYLVTAIVGRVTNHGFRGRGFHSSLRIRLLPSRTETSSLSRVVQGWYETHTLYH